MQAGMKLQKDWGETICRLVYEATDRLVRNYMHAGMRLQKGW